MVPVICSSLCMELCKCHKLHESKEVLFSAHIAHFLAKPFLASEITRVFYFSQMLLATNGGIDMFVMR